jgi:hypothetical protein
MLYSSEEYRCQSTYIILYCLNIFYCCINVVFVITLIIIIRGLALTVVNFLMRLSVSKGISKDSTFTTSVIAGCTNSNLWAMLLPIFLEGPPCNNFCGFNICFPQEVIYLPLLIFSEWWVLSFVIGSSQPSIFIAVSVLHDPLCIVRRHVYHILFFITQFVLGEYPHNTCRIALPIKPTLFTKIIHGPSRIASLMHPFLTV